MRIAVSSLGTSLDAWAGGPFGTCSQFLVVDTETMDSIVIGIPPEGRDPSKVSLAAIRAIAKQEAEVVITGQIKEICRQALASLGIEVIEGVEGVSVRDAVSLYQTGGQRGVTGYEPPQSKVAVASHGQTLDAPLSPRGEVCTRFLLVDPQTMDFDTVDVEPASTPEQASVNAVRAAARSGATVVITPEIRPACCTALRALAITVALADEHSSVREAVEAYRRGELATPSYL